MGERIYGYHAIEEALKKAFSGSTLYIERKVSDKLKALEFQAICTGKVAVKKVNRAELDRMAPGLDHRGAILDMGGPRKGASRLKEVSVEDFIASLEEGRKYLVMILDGITDPHNLGAILRSCDQFSADLVIIPERRSVQANETVVKVSSGAAQYVPISVVTNLSREIEKLKAAGFWVYAADMNGESSYKTEFSDRTCIVMGSEGDGISSLVRKNSDYVVSIPMTGHIDSLNVSVAAGILMYEFRRS
ncbi:MAG TPA: 23S rRNA (guanosine(2251)-2'-O)-methyltransferase RlmB [Candidatus Ornithospirochaeta avicola]|uniref:23S rRNA (Guanosine(2251)-2'-O)-methyltransferase RlmB n=1 Tax=Candidatus Ornithospirochaeta avicola TaxID=2840896 RepID=A0A9D1TMG2_9SPIO|nr:23S rRNA (guanosine(2251)-2'-O)-methyltransferase RlmB [Candidatus Ornithospirochaeta avicola]